MRKGPCTWWMVVLGLLILSPWSAQAQERSVFSSPPQEKPAPLAQVVAPVILPADWGTLRSTLPLAGDPTSYALFFEDAVGNIRIVPLHLTLVGGGWQYAVTRDPAVIIKRGP